MQKRNYDVDFAISEGRRFLENPNIRLISAENVLYFAQKIIENYKIAPRDSITFLQRQSSRTQMNLLVTIQILIGKEIKRKPI